MSLKRRSFLKLSGTSIASASLGGMTSALSALSASAQTSGDYKAMVCLFLFGGMDCHDTVIPYDSASYEQWASIRSSLVALHGASRSRDNLLPITAANSNLGGRAFALSPQMPNLQALFNSGNAAIVGNVGPLVAPTDADSFEQQAVSLPARLFSHNDQQATWMAGGPEGALTGWAGLFADVMTQRQTSDDPTFAAVSAGGGELIATGKQVVPFRVGPNGAVQPYVVDGVGAQLGSQLAAHFSGSGYGGTNLIVHDVKGAMNQAYTANEQYNAAAANLDLGDITFPNSPLGRQLQTIAQTIALREELNSSRQIFTAAIGGFDTHDNQANTLPGLHSQIDAAVSAFHQAMVTMGLDQDVVLFTASDFGRTLAINGDGTDHGWGGHHFVVGGGVAGGRIHGSIPEARFGHSLDAGGGRLIPDTSVEQFAAPLGRWFGLNDVELDAALPNLRNFSSEPALFG